jgi:hypothetical protein
MGCYNFKNIRYLDYIFNHTIYCCVIFCLNEFHYNFIIFLTNSIIFRRIYGLVVMNVVRFSQKGHFDLKC